MIELKETYDPPYNLWYGVKHKNLLRFKITYGGSLPNASALPPKALMPGVMFHMENDGSNYMWNGVAWDKMDSNPFVGATSSKDGIQGLVPQPKIANREGFLYGGGGWKNLDASDVKTGVFDLARIPAAALERLVTVADQTERYALTTSTVQNGDTVLQSDTQVMYRVVDQTELDNSAGYVEYQAARASVVSWSGITGIPSTFTPAMEDVSNTFTWVEGEEPPHFFAFTIGKMLFVFYQGKIKTHSNADKLGETTLNIADTTYLPFVKYGTTYGAIAFSVQNNKVEIIVTDIGNSSASGRIYFNGCIALA